MITKKTFAAMIVPSIAPTWMYAARGANSSDGAPGGEHDEARHGDREQPLVAAEQPAEAVVDEPGEREPADRDQRSPRSSVRSATEGSTRNVEACA